MPRITLETKRLILRPFEINDAESMFNNWAKDYEVTKYLTWCPHQSIDETAIIINKFIERANSANLYSFGIVVKEENKLIGSIDIVGFEDEIPVIGYCMSKAYWNKGIMTEACQKIVDFLFSIGYNKIRIDAVKENIGSNRVIQKCGGVLFNTEEEYFKQKDQTFTVNHYYINKE